MLAIVNTVREMDRMRQIATVLWRHGFREVVQRIGLGKPESSEPLPDSEARKGIGERIRLVLQDLGPSFVKLGQIVSTRPDLIPADIVRELKKLQDAVPPIPYEQVKEVIETSLGQKVEEVYSFIDEKPLASASIGQVHRARLRTDEGEIDVVIKVQRPNIRPTIERDIDLLYLFARLVERTIPESKIYSPVGLVGEFDRAIMAELDFQTEANNAETFAKNFDGNLNVRFPKVYRQATSNRVLTLEFFDGKKVYAAVEGGASGETIAKNAVAIIAQMIFVDGLFHADPHPGNILILGPPEAPVVGMLDLGLVGRMVPSMREKAIDLMVAAVRNDTGALADALLAMGRPRGKVDKRAFHAEVARLSEVHLGKPLKEMELAALIRDLVQGAIKFEIEMPTEIVMVGKALMTVEGIGKEIYPDLDVFAEARPFFLKLLKQRYSPQRIGQELLKGITRLGSAAQDLPGQVQEILEDLRSGRLRVEATDPNLVRAGDRLGRRVFSAVVFAALVWAGTTLELAGRHGAAMTLFVAAGTVIALHWWKDRRG